MGLRAVGVRAKAKPGEEEHRVRDPAPRELAQRLARIHGRAKRVDAYLCVMAKAKCWEGRNLKASEKALIAVGQDDRIAKARDFTPYLNAWQLLTKALQRR
jgi:hypothetical protein